MVLRFGIQSLVKLRLWQILSNCVHFILIFHFHRLQAILVLVSSALTMELTQKLIKISYFIFFPLILGPGHVKIVLVTLIHTFW